SSAPFSYPRWPVSSACSPRSSAALTSAGTNPPSPVSSTFPASICSKRASSCPEAFSCSTKSWPDGSPCFFSSVMVMILTVPLGTAYTDHLTRPPHPVTLGPPPHRRPRDLEAGGDLADRHTLIDDEPGDDQTVFRGQCCVSVGHKRAFLVRAVLSQVPLNQQGPPLLT